MHNKYFAAIDVGTNSFHVIIVKILENGKFKIIDKEREVIRLGSLNGRTLSLIAEEEIEHAIKILAGFKKIANFYFAEIKAIATSAVREAKNKDTFIKRILDETGIKIDVIEGNEEAKLINLGVSKALSLKNKKSLCLDIGGGSTEFILADKEKIIYAESVKIGAVRLSKKFFDNFILSDQLIADCSGFVEQQILSNAKIILNESFEIAAGSSGTIQSIAGMINFKKKGKQVKSLNKFSFSRNELQLVAEEILSHKTKAERLQIKGIEEKRADIIPSGIIILSKIFELFNIKEIVVSDYALREGIVINYIAQNGSAFKEHLF